MITSTSNSRIKEIRRLQSSSRARRESNSFVVEGLRLVEEAAGSGWPVRLVLHTPQQEARGQELLDLFRQRGVQVESVSEQVLRSASDTQSPQGLLALVERQPPAAHTALDFLLILDNLRDPGNLGSILRTAAAAGVQLAVLTPGCADPYAPKVLRGGMGAHFRLALRQESWPAIADLCAQNTPPLQVFLAQSSGELPYTAANFRQPLALLIGSEAHGAGRQAHQLSQQGIYIPMHKQVESLNAAAAAAVLLFEAARQRSE